MKTAIIAIVAVLVVGGGGYLLLHKDSNDNSKNTSSQSSQSSTNHSKLATKSSEPSAATITYSDSGYSPSTVTVKAGDTITLKNTSSRSVQFDSDPHPEHTEDPELNVGIVAPGESATFKVSTVGSHGYHNHLNSSDTGTIVVQ